MVAWQGSFPMEIQGGGIMLRLTVSPEEYLLIGDEIKIIFLGGTKNHLRIMVDAPREMSVLRSPVLESQITDPEERAKLPKYYREPDYKGPVKKSCKEPGRRMGKQK